MKYSNVHIIRSHYFSVGAKIYEFLNMHPEVLKDYSKKERVSKIRTKIINKRRQNREDLELRLKKLTK